MNVTRWWRHAAWKLKKSLSQFLNHGWMNWALFSLFTKAIHFYSPVEAHSTHQTKTPTPHFYSSNSFWNYSSRNGAKSFQILFSYKNTKILNRNLSNRSEPTCMMTSDQQRKNWIKGTYLSVLRSGDYHCPSIFRPPNSDSFLIRLSAHQWCDITKYGIRNASKGSHKK